MKPFIFAAVVLLGASIAEASYRTLYKKSGCYACPSSFHTHCGGGWSHNGDVSCSWGVCGGRCRRYECNPGYSGGDNSGSCSQCPGGKYKSGYGAGSCSNCPATMTSGAGASFCAVSSTSSTRHYCPGRQNYSPGSAWNYRRYHNDVFTRVIPYAHGRTIKGTLHYGVWATIRYTLQYQTRSDGPWTSAWNVQRGNYGHVEFSASAPASARWRWHTRCDSGCYNNWQDKLDTEFCMDWTKSPTKRPTTKNPTKKPTKKPTKNPTKKPTKNPTKYPTTKNPTKKPTKQPTKNPTKDPTKAPTLASVSLLQKKLDDWCKSQSFDNGDTVARYDVGNADQPSSTWRCYRTHGIDWSVKGTDNCVDNCGLLTDCFGVVDGVSEGHFSRPDPLTDVINANRHNTCDTAQPTAGPTNSPTDEPTNSPTVSPTEGPTNSPTTLLAKRMSAAAALWEVGVDSATGDFYKCDNPMSCKKTSAGSRNSWSRTPMPSPADVQMAKYPELVLLDGTYASDSDGVTFTSTDGLEEFYFPWVCDCAGK